MDFIVNDFFGNLAFYISFEIIISLAFYIIFPSSCLLHRRRKRARPHSEERKPKTGMGRWLLSIPALLWICLAIAQTQARPPQPPVRCTENNCSVSNAYRAWNDRKECWVSHVVYPATEEDIIQAVAQASRRKQKVKVVTGFGHTIPKVACPGSPPQNALAISTAKFNSMVEIDKEKMEVTADSGVGLRNLIDKIEEAGLSLVAAPYWEGASLGGIINTGSHGSSWWGKGGAVHDYVVRLNLVVPAGLADGFAKVLKLDSQNPLFNAAKVSLGQLGVVSKVFGFLVFIPQSFSNRKKKDVQICPLPRKLSELVL